MSNPLDSPPRAVLFDAVGTLLRPEPDVASVYHAIARRHGSRLERAEIARRFRPAFERVFQIRDDASTPLDDDLERRRWREVVGRVLDDIADLDAPFDELWRHFAQPRHWRLYDDAAAAWNALQAAGMIVGVASNFDRRLADIVAGLPLLADARVVVWSTQVGAAKPAPAFFRAIEQRLGLPAEQLVLVGDDSACDYAGARAAGWRAALLDRGGRARGDNVLHSLAELPAWLATHG